MAPIVWLTRKLPGQPQARSILIARWMLNVHKRGAWGQLTKDRELHIPGRDELAHFNFMDRIDEIQDADLEEGPATDVTAAFDRASRRAASPILAKMEKDYKILNQSGWPLYTKSMRELNTPAALIKEGNLDMTHCVAAYAEPVRSKQSVILALNVNGRRSTVELAWAKPGGPPPKERQHFGCHNGPPPRANVELLAKWMKKVFPGGR